MKRKGIFGGPLVLQTFAVHLTAIGGAVTVPSIGDPGNAKGALALSAAAVFTNSILFCTSNLFYRLNEDSCCGVMAASQ